MPVHVLDTPPLRVGHAMFAFVAPAVCVLGTAPGLGMRGLRVGYACRACGVRKVPAGCS